MTRRPKTDGFVALALAGLIGVAYGVEYSGWFIAVGLFGVLCSD